MTTNGGPLTTNELALTVKWTPSTGQVSVSFPQIDHTMIFGMLEMAKEVLREIRSKAEQRVVIPDMKIAKQVIS